MGNETIHKTIHKLYIILVQLLYSPVRYGNKMYKTREVSVFTVQSCPRWPEAAVDAWHALHLAVCHIVVELLVRGAGGVVADAAAGQFAVYHRGVAPVMMHMLRFLDFHRR